MMIINQDEDQEEQEEGEEGYDCGQDKEGDDNEKVGEE